MATHPIRSGLLALAVGTWLAATAAAQSENDYVPHVGSGDLDIGAPADLSLYGDYPKPNEGWFLQYDALYWNITGPETTTIGREGYNPAVSDGNQLIFQPNTVDTGWIDNDWRYGNRIELGFVRNDKGWFVSGFKLNSLNQVIFNESSAGVSFLPEVGPDGVLSLEGFVDINGDGFDDDLNMNNVFGRDGIDTGTPNANPPPPFVPPPDGIPDTNAPVDFGDLVYFPVFFDRLEARNRVRVEGIELNHLCRRYPGHRWAMVELFAGARYFRLRDDFDVYALGGILNPGATSDDPIDNSFWNTTVDNNLVGGQLGARILRKCQRLTLIGEGRFFAGVNVQNFDLQGKLGQGLTPGADNAPLDLDDTSFHDSDNTTEFAPLGEFRLQANYQVTQAIQFQAGWTAIYVDGLARASNSIDYRIPDMRITTADNREDIFINGVTFGIEVNR